MKNVDWYSILAPVYKNATLTSEPKKSITVAVYDPCSEYYLLAYLNSETVQKAIHVKPTNLQYVWQPCNHTITNSWSQDDIDLILWRLGLGGPGDGDNPSDQEYESNG
ncbi:unnamed protein product [Brassica rapa subsp. trilocularis]